MATWRDGPAYAPLERPTAFAQPATGVSLDPPEAGPPTPEPPRQPPTSFTPPTDPVVPLDRLASATSDQRDPTQAFDVVAATITSGSAWGSAHRGAPGTAPVVSATWAADQPWQSQYAPPPAINGGFPAPGTPQWFATGPLQPARQVTVPVSVKTVAQSVGLPYLITLGLGLVINSVATFSLILAFFFAALARYRRKRMRYLLLATWGGAFALMLFAQLSELFSLSWVQAAQLGCLVALIGGVVMQWLAMLAGEKPEHTP